jgi:hypothetical protein
MTSAFIVGHRGRDPDRLPLSSSPLPRPDASVIVPILKREPCDPNSFARSPAATAGMMPGDPDPVPALRLVGATWRILSPSTGRAIEMPPPSHRMVTNGNGNKVMRNLFFSCEVPALTGA